MWREKLWAKSLSTRVMISAIFLVVVLALCYSFAIWRSVHFVEAYLMSESMAVDFQHIKEDLESEGAPRLDEGESVYGSGIAGLAPIPERFKGLAEGYEELGDSPAVYVYKEKYNGGELVYVRDQENFEHQENLLWLQTAVFGVLVILLGGALGLWLSRRLILKPVHRLAQEVQASARSSPYKPISESVMTSDEIGELARICNNALGRLYSSLEREKSFTRDVSHELRTPLTVIATSAELLALTPLDDKQRRQLEKITHSADMMRDLVSFFLQLARQSSDAPQEAGGDTVASLLRRCASVWREPAARKGLELRVKATGLCPGSYSPVLLVTVVNNLVRNAVEYTDRGIVELEETSSGFLVRDTGPGIAPGERDAVFQDRRRGSAAQGNPDVQGCGLGLSIVKKICSRTGWTVELRSSGAGSVFEVNLVVQPAPGRLDSQQRRQP